MPMYLNPCSTRMGLSASARSRLPIAGQIYCAATTLQKRKPKATVMPQMRGIGMMRSFLHLGRLHDATMRQRDSGVFRLLRSHFVDTSLLIHLRSISDASPSPENSPSCLEYRRGLG